jgi:DNA gyrase subunit A
MRYTEARLTEIAEELLADIEKNTVPFYPNFDGSLQQPAVLPSKLPNLLLNGSSGIAVGMATTIPPHNLTELIDAINYVIENWGKLDDIEPDDLMQFVKGPDFPTGGIILGADGIKEAYATGKGKLVVRGKVHTETVAGGKARIVITELPYQVNKASLIERIAELVRDKRIEDIADLRDESDRQGMSIIIELKRGVEPTPVINQLLKLTALQSTYSINLLALVSGEPRVLSLKKALQVYVEHRQEVVTNRTRFELERAKAREHILEGLKIALDYLDEVIKTIRQSPDADVAKERLMKRFKLSELQAQAILDMQLRRLAALERKKIEDELAEVKKRIKHFEELLRSPKKILGVIQDECRELKERFGDARRTFIAASEATEFQSEANVPEQQVIVSLTRNGNIKWMPASDYRRTRTDAKSGVVSRVQDPVLQLFYASTTDNLILFSNQGRAFPLRMHQVPDEARNPSGLALRSVSGLENEERIVFALALSAYPEAESITLASKTGKIKRTALNEFETLSSGGVRAINLGQGDELIAALHTHGTEELIVVTAKGQALRFKCEEVPVQGRSSAGVWAMKLADADKLIAVEVVRVEGHLLLASQQGFIKRTLLKEFPTKGRYTGGVVTYSTEARTGLLAAARVVAEDEDAVFVTQNGSEIRLRVENAPKANRGARGKQIFDLKGGDTLTGVVALGNSAGSHKDEGTLENGDESKPRAQKETKVKEPKSETTAKPELTVEKSKDKPVIEARKKGARGKARAPRKSRGNSKSEQMEFAAFKPLPKKKK